MSITTDKSWRYWKTLSNVEVEKCESFTNCIYYLGYCKVLACVVVCSRTDDTICWLQTLSNIQDVCSFLGLCKYPLLNHTDFCSYQSPSQPKIAKGQPRVYTEWSDEDLGTLIMLQEKLISPKGLYFLAYRATYTVVTDACGWQIGCVVPPTQLDRHDKRIGYWSRFLVDAEQLCDTAHIDCLAIVRAVLLLFPCLEGTHSIFPTNNDALNWILNLADTTGQFAQWLLSSSEMVYDVFHRTAIKHRAADTL